jgi:hypothetical protein
MPPLTSFGVHALSSSLAAICVQRMEKNLRTQHTKPARMTYFTTWSSSVEEAPLKSQVQVAQQGVDGYAETTAHAEFYGNVPWVEGGGSAVVVRATVGSPLGAWRLEYSFQ